MSTPINILKNDQTVLRWFESATISMTDGYCFSIDLSLNSLDLWDNFNPEDNKGELNLKVLIGTQTYEFLCEEREVPVGIEGSVFSVWGRTKQALLDKPYSRTIKDTDTTNHPWQSTDVTVSEVIEHILDNYCDYDVTVTWNVENFLIYNGTFSVDERSPIEVISSLADIIGAKLNAHPDGSLTIDYYSVAEETPVESYNDFDHIVALNESTQYSEGYNAITISGKGAANNSPQLSYEVIEADEDDTSWVAGKPRRVRVYYYHPTGSGILHYEIGNASVRSAGSGIKTTTEDVLLTWGSGSQSLFDTDGDSEVTGTASTPLESRSVTYRTNYLDFSVSVSGTDESHIMFYFADKSANTVLSITPSEKSEKEQEQCASLSVSAANVGSQIKITCYGNPYVIDSIVDMYQRGLKNPTTPDNLETITEYLTVTDGEGTLSKPYYDNLEQTTFSGGGSIRVYLGSNKVTSTRTTPFVVKVKYRTQPYYSMNDLPDYFNQTEYHMFVTDVCGSTQSLSVSFDTTDNGDSGDTDEVTGTEEEKKTMKCSSISLSFKDSKLRFQGDVSLIDSVYDMFGNSLSGPTGYTTEKIENESVSFSDGQGSLSNVFDSGMIKHSLSRTSATIKTLRYAKDVELYSNADLSGTIYAIVSYKTGYAEADIDFSKMDTDYDFYEIFVDTVCGGTVSLSIDISNRDSDGNIILTDDDGNIITVNEDGDVIDTVAESDCSSCSISDGEFRGSTGIVLDDTWNYRFRFYGNPAAIKKVWCTSGDEVTILSTDGDYEEVEEFVQFTNGVGSITKSYDSGLELSFTSYSAVSPSGTCEKYGQQITLDPSIDYTGENKFLFADVSYNSSWLYGKVNITSSTSDFTIYLETACGELLSLSDSKSSDSDETITYSDVTITVKDYATDVIVAGANVYVDGGYRGKTDGDGNIVVRNLATGDHTLYITATGYQNSDEDELANDTFTVS